MIDETARITRKKVLLDSDRLRRRVAIDGGAITVREVEMLGVEVEGRDALSMAIRRTTVGGSRTENFIRRRTSGKLGSRVGK